MLFLLLVGSLLSSWVSLDTLWLRETGPLSVYSPGDGCNRGVLACGGKFTDRQRHLAHRKWWKLGCGRLVVVYSEQTGKMALTKLYDSGPFGVLRGPTKRARVEGRWKVHVGPRPPPGWRWRGLVDLSVALWKDLGSPRFLSPVHLWFLPVRLLG